MKKPCRRFSDKAESGANSRDRTDDLRITNALLYQLSYIGGKRTSIYHLLGLLVKHVWGTENEKRTCAANQA